MRNTILLLSQLIVVPIFGQDSLYIFGRVNNYLPESPHVSTIALYIDEPASVATDSYTYYTNLRNSGDFKFSVPFSQPQDILFHYGEFLFDIYAEVGDSLYLSFDADTLGLKGKKIQNLSFEGPHSDLNYFIQNNGE
ncbi:MAG: hypothetical protein AAGD28_29780, partial [Bacteroidota bacterium]